MNDSGCSRNSMGVVNRWEIRKHENLGFARNAFIIEREMPSWAWLEALKENGASNLKDGYKEYATHASNDAAKMPRMGCNYE